MNAIARPICSIVACARFTGEILLKRWRGGIQSAGFGACYIEIATNRASKFPLAWRHCSLFGRDAAA